MRKLRKLSEMLALGFGPICSLDGNHCTSYMPIDERKQPIRLVMAPSATDKAPLAFPVRVFLGELELKGVISAHLSMYSNVSHTHLWIELVPVDGLIIEQPEGEKETPPQQAELDMRGGVLRTTES